MSRRWMGWEEVGRDWWPVCVTASDEPLPTTMLEEEQGLRAARLPDEEDMCAEAPVSRYHGPGADTGCGCWTERLFNAWMRPAWSHVGGGALDEAAPGSAAATTAAGVAPG
jgi:hypothetical protein